MMRLPNNAGRADAQEARAAAPPALSPHKKFIEVIERRVDVEKVFSECGLVAAFDLRRGGSLHELMCFV